MAALELSGVTVRYGTRVVLDAIDLRVGERERVALIGPNGSGKTTLLRALAGIVKPDAGRARPAGDLDRAALARRLSFLPQEEFWEFPFTVAQVVACGRFVFRDHDAGAVEGAIARVGLAGLRDRPITELSGGERRLALLARSLAQQAPALLLDEPTTALDLEHRHAVLSILAALEGAVLLSTHDLDAAASCARVVVLDKGRIAADGAPGQVLTVDLLRDVFHVEARILREEGRIHVVAPV